MVKNFLVTALILILLGVSVFFGLSSFNSKQREIEYDGRLRKYILHTPSGYYEKDSYPLVVALHSFTGNARFMEINSGLSQKADQAGFFVAYPHGSKATGLSVNSWNAEFCCGYAMEQGIDDVGFVAKVIEEIVGKYNIDPKRIYVVGFSNGGMLAHQVALKLPDKIAAVGVVAGAVGGMREEAEEYEWLDQSGVPVPIIIFHGKNDSTVPFDGGKAGGGLFEFTAAYDSVNLWLQNNKCNFHPMEILKTDNYTKESYGECANDAEVIFYALNTKHVWPGSWNEIFNNFSGRNVRATDIIWEFFSAHKK